MKVTVDIDEFKSLLDEEFKWDKAHKEECGWDDRDIVMIAKVCWKQRIRSSKCIIRKSEVSKMPTIKIHEKPNWSINEMIITGVTLNNGEVTAITTRESANDGESKEFVSVVHCRDCRYNSGGFCECHKHYTDKDDFCSYGVRKNEEDKQ